MRLRLVCQSHPINVNAGMVSYLAGHTNAYVLQQHDGVAWKTLPMVIFEKLSNEEQEEITESYKQSQVPPT